MGWCSYPGGNTSPCQRRTVPVQVFAGMAVGAGVDIWGEWFHELAESKVRQPYEGKGITGFFLSHTFGAVLREMPHRLRLGAGTFALGFACWPAQV